MKLTDADKSMILKWGYSKKDLAQIEEATQTRYTEYWMAGSPILREKAISLLGRERYLSGIARSAFHATAARTTNSGKVIYFDSSKLFR